MDYAKYNWDDKITETMLAARISEIQQLLLPWFGKNQRRLPWRKKYLPYEVWISEIMLQQTQVATVLPYFERWMKAFPTIKAVAEASEDQLLKLWEGLGYYHRALNIQKTARLIMEKYSGDFPKNYEDIIQLPGIGAYTAGAICSIAFNQDRPVVDGNVVRVLARLLDYRENVNKNRSFFWKTAASLIPKGQARRFNQAMMEFGALQCIPKNPTCNTCPLQKQCKAYKAGTQNDLPFRGGVKSKVPIQVSIAIIQKNGKIFIQKRKDTGLMAGLWEFPGGQVEKGESPQQALHREIDEELGIQIKNLRPFMQFRHSYTKYLVHLHCFLAEYDQGRIQLQAASRSKWVKPRNLSNFAFPAANVKLIDRLLQKF